MEQQRRDWLPLIVLAVAGTTALAGIGFLGSSTVDYLQHKPATEKATADVGATTRIPDAASTLNPLSPPTPGTSATVDDRLPQCSFADFPYYPGSSRYNISPPMPNSWYVNQPTAQVASYFAHGAYQKSWSFIASSSATLAPNSSVMSYKFRFVRAPACRGELRIFPETLQGGASFYQMIPDSP